MVVVVVGGGENTSVKKKNEEAVRRKTGGGGEGERTECKAGSRGGKRGRCGRKNNKMQRGRKEGWGRGRGEESGEEEEEHENRRRREDGCAICSSISSGQKFLLTKGSDLQGTNSLAELHVNDVAGQNVALCDGSERRAEVPTSITANTATL